MATGCFCKALSKLLAWEVVRKWIESAPLEGRQGNLFRSSSPSSPPSQAIRNTIANHRHQHHHVIITRPSAPIILTIIAMIMMNATTGN